VGEVYQPDAEDKAIEDEESEVEEGADHDIEEFLAEEREVQDQRDTINKNRKRLMSSRR